MSVDLDNPLFHIPGTVGSGVYQELTPLTNDDLTTRNPNGSGTFDALMESVSKHLMAEFQANRITGAEYTKAYAALVEAAMGNAVQYLLGRDQAYWMAVKAQAEAITARVALELAKLQVALTQEQLETQRAQTLDTRSDGTTPVSGLIGSQKNLYAQQITSYQRDAETKAAKMFSDAWITQKTIDEGLEAPVNFTNASVDGVLTSIKTNNNLGS